MSLITEILDYLEDAIEESRNATAKLERLKERLEANSDVDTSATDAVMAEHAANIKAGAAPKNPPKPPKSVSNPKG